MDRTSTTGPSARERFYAFLLRTCANTAGTLLSSAERCRGRHGDTMKEKGLGSNQDGLEKIGEKKGGRITNGRTFMRGSLGAARVRTGAAVFFCSEPHSGCSLTDQIRGRCSNGQWLTPCGGGGGGSWTGSADSRRMYGRLCMGRRGHNYHNYIGHNYIRHNC